MTRIGLALAGGGPLGAVYEIGALCALEEAVDGLSFTQLDGYVGVSAGAMLAAGLANGLSPRALCRSFIENDGPPGDIIRPALFIRPAWGELLSRVARAPHLIARAAAQYAGPRGATLAALERLGGLLPTGLFSNASLELHLRRMLSAPGRSNDFRRLGRRLVIVATDLDSGEAAPFGQPGWDHVPISQAVVASAAMPGLFPPVPIHGRWYADGALKKTLHASVLLEDAPDLVLCLNPLVPFDAREHRHRVGDTGARIPRIVDGGLPVVLSQTFRTLIHSRLGQGLKGYETTHPDTDILLFEPDRRDPTLFLANLFSYANRRALAEHAYQQTRADLRSRRSSLGRTLARHGLTLNDAVLDDPHRRLLPGRRPRHDEAAWTVRRLGEVLDDLERTLAAWPTSHVTEAARGPRAVQPR